MRRILSWITALALVPVTAAGAQPERGSLRMGFGIGTMAFGGAAEPIEDRGDNLRAMPFRPTMWGITISYGSAGMRVGLAAAYGQPGMAVRGNPPGTPDAAGDGLLIVADNAFRLTAFSATISTRLKHFSAGPSLRPSLGLLLERWASPGTPTQTLLGAGAGLLLEIPLTRSLSGTVLGEAGYTPGSPFRMTSLPDGFRSRSTWRRAISGGVMLKL